MARILVVEDSEHTRELLRRRLQRLGHELCFAIKGQEAMMMVASKSPDLILMDMSLPDMDGWEVTRKLRDSSVGRRVVIVALTAHAMAGDEEKAYEVGCQEYLPKPIDFPNLFSVIDRHCGPVSPSENEEEG